MIVLDDDYLETAWPGTIGSAHAVSDRNSDGDDVVRRLREVAAEISGEDFTPPPKRIGFI